MDARVGKLSRLIPLEDAVKLVAAGIDSPKKIKAATDTELKKYLSASRVTALRTKIKRNQ